MASTSGGGRAQAGKQSSRQEAEETPVEESAEVAERHEELTEDVDDLLDEIDSVLEENSEDFVRSYVQKGGQ